MACSKPKNPTQTPLNLEELQRELIRLNHHNNLYSAENKCFTTVGKVRVPKALSPVWPDWKNEQTMTNYCHLHSLISDTQFQWYHLHPDQYLALQRWTKGLSSDMFEFLRFEDPEYQTHKFDLLLNIKRNDNEQWKKIVEKLHAVGRSSTVKRLMKLKRGINRFRQTIHLQMFRNRPGNSTNDTNVFSGISSTIGSLFRSLANIPSATMAIIAQVKQAIKRVIEFLKVSYRVTNLVSVNWYAIALAFVYILAVVYFKSVGATIVLSIITAVCAFQLDDNILLVASALIGGVAFGYNSAVYPTTDVKVSPTNQATTTINIYGEGQVKKVYTQSPPVYEPIKIIAFAFAVLASVYCPFDSAWKAFLDKCDKLPKAVNGIGKMMSLFEDYFGSYTNEFLKKTTGYSVEEMNPIPQEVIENYEKTRELLKLDTYSDMPSDAGVCLRIEQVYIDYMRLRQLYHNNRVICEYMNTYQGSLVDLFRRASAANPRVSSERPKPTCIFFTGTTGVGKTSMIYLLTADILKRYGVLEGKTNEQILELVNKSVYARNATQEFFDGYQNQLVTVIDDFGCMVDAPAHPCSDFEEILHMVNNFPYPLPMASLSQKANTYFTSRFVFLTSNLKDINPTSMINPEAVRSRIAARYDIRVKREYQVNPDSSRVEDHRIDVSKTRPKFGNKSVVDIYEIVVFNAVTGQQERTISYDQLVEEVCRHHDGERVFFDLKQESIIDHLNRVHTQAFPWPFTTNTQVFGDWLVADVDPINHPFRPYIINQARLASFFQDHPNAEYMLEMPLPRFAGPNHFKYVRALDRLLEAKRTRMVDPYVSMCFDAFMENRCGEEQKPQFDPENPFDTCTYNRGDQPDDMYVPDTYYETLCYRVEDYTNSVKHIINDLSRMDIAQKCQLVLWYVSVIGTVITVGKTLYEVCSPPDTTYEQNHERYMEFLRLKQEHEARQSESGKTKRVNKSRTLEDDIELYEESGKSKRVNASRLVEGDDDLVSESGKSKKISKQRLVEAFSSIQAQEVSKMVQSHYRDLLCQVGDETHLIGHFVALKGHWCLINKHYIYSMQNVLKLDPKSRLVVAAAGHTNGTEISFSCILAGREIMRAGENTDMWVFKLPPTANMAGDLTRHFHTRAMMNDVAVNMSTILTVPGNPVVVHACHLTARQTGSYEVVNNDDTIYVLKCLMYEFDARTSKGDCGSLYIADSNGIRNKIIGFHFAGQSSGGACAMPLVKEDFDFLEKEPLVEQSPEITPGMCSLATKVNGIIPLGTAKPVHGSIKTSLERTSVFNQVQETTVMPARLGRLLEEDGAGMKAIQKVLPTVPEIPEDELDMAEQSFCEKLYCGRRATSRVFSPMEAITGIIPEDEPYIRAINRSTSPGYPWMLKTKHGKKDMFDYNERTAEWSVKPLGQEVLELVERKDQEMEDGKYEHAIYVDTLKDETRATAKVLAGKTRLFSAAPVDYVILFRMYFLAFLNWCMTNRISNEICVGICAQSTDWNKLALTLRKMGNNIVAGDFSNYDGTLNPGILLRVLNIINRWYADGNGTKRSFLFEDIIHSVHIAEDNVYQWTHSQPSGNPGTAVINSIYNSIACRISFNRLTKGTKYFGRFNDYVSMVSYGDDNLLSIHTEILDIVNQQSLTRAFASFGMIYTDETKSSTAIPYKKLSECGFLKRGFRYDSSVNLWLGPLTQDSINERLNWQHKCPDPEAILRLNAEGAIAEWAFHDNETFLYWAKRIQNVFLAKGVYIPVYAQTYYTTMLLDSRFNVVFPQLEFAGNSVPQVLATESPQLNFQIMDHLVTEQPTTTTRSALNNAPSNPTFVGNPNTETVNTIRFTNEGEVPQHASSNTSESSQQLSIVNDARFHQIKNFLERPHRVENVTEWKKGSYDLMYEIKIVDELKKMLSTLKMAGFYGFKGTCKLRVLTNAQPFHSGLLQVAYLPKYETFPTSKDDPQPMGGFYPTGLDSFVMTRYESGCPSVLLNLGSSSACEIKVPYVGAQSLMDLTPGETMFGTFHIRALVPLADSTNNPTCGLSAYISFEDVHLFATTPISFDSKKVEAQGMDLSALIQALQGLSASQSPATPPTQTEEAQSNKTGVVSGIANTVGNVASKLTAIPGLADIAGPVSWVANGVGSVAKMFGFSKPHASDSSEPVWVNPFKDFPLCEGNDHSTKLTVTPHAEVHVSPIGETAKDEMNITHILSKPVAFAGYGWKKEHKPGTMLAAIPINPLSFRDQMPSFKNSAVSMSSHTFVSYIASLFRYWMGTIRITMTIVGNKFYSGRLRFVYVPNVNLGFREALAPQVWENMQHTYAHIVDIRDANTFTIDCAYVALTPWKRTSYVTESGVLYIFVEQQLAHPDTVGSELVCYTHVSGLEDLTFAGPTRPRGSPMMGWDADKDHFPNREKLEFQGFTLPLSDQHAPTNIPIVNDVNRANPEEAHKSSIGDPVTSLRQLAKRFIINDVVKWTTDMLLLQPFKLSDAQDDPSVTKTKFVSADFIDYISFLYRFRKGGMRVAMRGFGDENVLAAHRNITQLKADNTLNLYSSNLDSQAIRPSIVRQVEMPEAIRVPESYFAPVYSFVPHQENIQGILQVEMPYYHEFSLMENNRFRHLLGSDPSKPDTKMAAPQDIPNLTTSNTLIVTRKSGDAKEVEIYRAAADDFNCGFLLGPPPTLDMDRV